MKFTLKLTILMFKITAWILCPIAGITLAVLTLLGIVNLIPLSIIPFFAAWIYSVTKRIVLAIH